MRRAREADGMDVNVTVEPVKYEVTAYPLRDELRRHFTITVEWRSPDRWAVCNRMGECWNRRTKTWDYESMPSSRTDAFKRTHRFPLDEAIEIAKKIAPTLGIMSWTMDQIIRRNNGENLCGQLVTQGVRCDLLAGHEGEHKP